MHSEEPVWKTLHEPSFAFLIALDAHTAKLKCLPQISLKQHFTLCSSDNVQTWLKGHLKHRYRKIRPNLLLGMKIWKTDKNEQQARNLLWAILYLNARHILLAWWPEKQFFPVGCLVNLRSESSDRGGGGSSIFIFFIFAYCSVNPSNSSHCSSNEDSRSR